MNTIRHHGRRPSPPLKPFTPFTPFTPSLLVLGVLAMIAALPAQAQDSPAKAPADESVVVVTGFRASLNSALNIKKNSDGIVDVIKAEDIAKFPTPTWPSRCSGCRACR